MSSLRLALAAGLFALFAPALAAAEQRIVLPDDVTPDHYDIAIVPDAKALTFTGKVRIDLTIQRATSTIVLNDADIVIDQVTLSGEAAAPKIGYDAEAQTASFAFDHPLAPGHYSLSLAYHGKIYQQASGLFALDYRAPGGVARALFTQFENSDARRFVPSWDEPGRKATFTLTATVPADQMALSNMPVAESTPLDGGLRKVRFAESPKMSSYLLFFGLGDFERVHRDVGGVDVGVVVKRGDTANARFALDTATQILPYYNTYFGKPYPLPKLDLIAGPGSSRFFSAMENWGAIFYFERALLIDPRVSTQSDHERVYTVVAHEMAHQWFGDLVTMDWWDDLWLNEGFASWMENKVTDHFHPEWNVWLQALADKDAAMQTDARDGAHPVITPIHDVLQAGGAFDEITYQKGSAVIRMLEAYAGEDNFRAGVRRYIAAHAYGNTVTNDLWREIDPVSPGRPITDIAHDFTLQRGIPLISEDSAACEQGRTSVTLQQGRFGVDATSRALATWRTPVNVAVIGGGAGQALVSAPRPASVSVDGCGPVVLNAGQTAYVRSRYTPEGMRAVTDHFPQLTPDDQLGLLIDAKALAYVGDAPMADYLGLTRRLDAQADAIVWRRLAGDLHALDRLYDGLPGQPRFRDFARAALAPAQARFGWDAKVGEDANAPLARESVLAALGELDDPAVVTEARQRFTGLVAAPASLSAASRRTVLAIVARHATPAEWEQLRHLALTAPSELERAEFYDLMGDAEDPVLAQRALDLALSGETTATTAPALIQHVGSRHPAMALAFLSAHWPQISAMLEPDTRATFAPDVVSGASDPAVADALTAFAEANIPATARQDTRKAVAAIAYSARVREQRLPEADLWLAAN
jgi:aminopeptidase N